MNLRFWATKKKTDDEIDQDEEEKRRKREEELARRAKEKPRENKGYFGEGTKRGKMLKELED
jgi:hypothetical protein